MIRHLTVLITLKDQGAPIATKTYTIHEDDIDESIYTAELKRRELFRDVSHYWSAGKSSRDFDVALTPQTEQEKLEHLERILADD